MIWSSTCWCTVRLRMGTSVSTRHSMLRAIQSALLIYTLRLAAGEAVAVAEGVDAGVLEEAADDGLDADVVRQARDAGAEAADAADDDHDVHAGLACGVEAVDEGIVDQRVHLEPDMGRAAGAGVGGFGVDEVVQGGAGGQRAEKARLSMPSGRA